MTQISGDFSLFPEAQLTTKNQLFQLPNDSSWVFVKIFKPKNVVPFGWFEPNDADCRKESQFASLDPNVVDDMQASGSWNSLSSWAQKLHQSQGSWQDLGRDQQRFGFVSNWETKQYNTERVCGVCAPQVDWLGIKNSWWDERLQQRNRKQNEKNPKPPTQI